MTISGLHYYENVPSPDEGNEPIEVITPGNYYYKNGRHYILYDELVEGVPGVIKNKIKIKENEMLEIIKTGITNSHMMFVKDKIHVTQYQTVYGEIVVGTHTKRLNVDVTEETIDVYVQYALDVDQEKLAECDIRMSIRANAPRTMDASAH